MAAGASIGIEVYASFDFSCFRDAIATNFGKKFPFLFDRFLSKATAELLWSAWLCVHYCLVVWFKCGRGLRQ